MTSKQLALFYEQFSSEDHVLVPIIADPDAIASAMAVKRLLWRKTASITITNINIIKRTDNQALVRLSRIKLIPVKEIDVSKFNRIVYVDSQPKHNEYFRKFKPDVIIDHHPETEVEAPYVDIRPQYGATATIMLEYLKAAKIKPSEKLATSMYYAIKTDTDNFNRKAEIDDVRAFQYLFPLSNLQMVRKIESAGIAPAFLKYFRVAIDNRKKRKAWMFSHLGSVPNPDVCVMIADFFLRVENINWTIVSGIHGNKLIIIFRSFGYRQNAGNIAHKAFKELGSAGGHKRAARAEIPLSNLKEIIDYKDEIKLSNWIIKQIKGK